MPDQLDEMLRGQNDPSAPDSQSQTAGQGLDFGEPSATEQLNPEEIEFNSLTGSTQDRIRKLVNDKRQLLEEKEKLLRAQMPPPPPIYGSNQPTPEVQDAVRKLSDVGIATDEKVERKINESLGQLRYDYEVSRLETKYSGEDGEPKFVRDEYEEYIATHPQYKNYLPEDIYKKMYEEELLNLEVQKRQGQAPKTTRTLKPTRTQVQGETMTPEYIEERLKQPDAQEWYTENVAKINAVLGKMS